jgi:hypothetical protein
VGDTKDDANVSKRSKVLSEVDPEVFLASRESVCECDLLFSFTYKRAFAVEFYAAAMIL